MQSNLSVSRGGPPVLAGVERGALAASGLLLLVLTTVLLTFGYGRDQGIYAVVARAILAGGAPYRDAWDFKPPGIFLLFAATRRLLGPAPWAIRVVEAAGWISLVAAFAVFSRRHLGSAPAGFAAGALALVGHVQLGFWHTAQPESFGAVAVAWALVCLTARPASSRGRQLAWLVAGTLYGCAALLKPPLGGGAALGALVVAWGERRARGRPPWSPLFWVGLGGLLPVAATGSWLALRGALPDAVETLFGFAPHYTALGFSVARAPHLLRIATGDWLVRFSPWLAPGMALLALLPPASRREREGIAHVLSATLPQIAGVALQAKFFPYHYGAALPLAALLGAWGYTKLWWLARSRPPAAVAVAVALGALALLAGQRFPPQRALWRECALRITALLDPQRRASILDRLHSVADVDAGQNRRVARWLRERVPPGRPVFVWGFEPVVYDLARRPAASRYIYNVPQRASWGAARARARLMADLRRRPPAAVVVERGDVMPWVTGNLLDSRRALDTFPALRTLLERAYRLSARIGDFEIYVPAAPLPEPGRALAPEGRAASRRDPGRAVRPARSPASRPGP